MLIQNNLYTEAFDVLKRAARTELVFYETEVQLYRKWRGRLLYSLIVAFYFQR